jgi:ElaB/YqjD/DUF883 family membrane-anchored ribosome-binding protein
MDQKHNSLLSSDKIPNASLNSAQEPRTLATASSAEIRKDVERVTGKFAKAADETKDQVADEAQKVKGEVVDAVDVTKEAGLRLADKVQQSGQKAIETTSALATSAINVAGEKVRQVQGRIDTAKSTASDYIHEDPVRAVTYTALGSAVLTAALIGIFRRR